MSQIRFFERTKKWTRNGDGSAWLTNNNGFVPAESLAEQMAINTLTTLAAEPPSSSILRDIVVSQIKKIEGREPTLNEINASSSYLSKKLKEAVIKLFQTLQKGINNKLLPEYPLWIIDDILWCDAISAKIIAEIGPKGKEVAIRLLNKAKQRWSEYSSGRLESASDAFFLWELWFKPKNQSITIPFASLCMAVLWHDRIKPALNKGALLPNAALPSIIRCFYDNNRSVISENESILIESKDKQILGSINKNGNGVRIPSAILEGQALSSTASIAGQTLIRWLPQRVIEHYAKREIETGLHGLPNFVPIIEICGGIEGLRKNLGLSSKKSHKLIENTLNAFQHMTLYVAGVEFHGLLTWSIQHVPTKMGRQSVLRITPAELFIPGAVHRLPKDQHLLFPVPSKMPPLQGARKTWNAQGTLQLWVMHFLRKHAIELLEAKAVYISEKDWYHMADNSSLSRAQLPKVIEYWQADHNNRPGGGPAFLKSINSNKWNLAPSYSREINDLLEGGNISKKQQLRAKRRKRR